MSDWLMAGVWRLTLRLPPAIGSKRVGRLAERAREVVGAVSAQHRAVHHFVVRELPRFGTPMPPQHIADGLDLPLPTVIGILADLEARKGFLFRNGDGEVVWAYPVTAEPTPHRIRFKSGETLYAA
ncbi:MAG: hypothetical protein GY788_22470 [bacterium]|nr:hypothetical protein [bacterium]